jgi:hypothetical protein
VSSISPGYTHPENRDDGVSTGHDAGLFTPPQHFVAISWRLIELVGYERAGIAAHIAFRTRGWDRRSTYEQDGHQWWNRSMVDMVAELHLSRSAIQRHLEALCKDGYLVREQHRRAGDRDQSYSYRPNIIEDSDYPGSGNVAAGHYPESGNGVDPSNDGHYPGSGNGEAHYPESGNDSSIKKELNNPRQAEEDRFFKEFFEAFPKKVDLPIARSVWRKVRSEGASPAEIIAGAQRYAASTDVIGRELQYVQKPHNWLHAHGWENEYTPAGVSDRSYIDRIPVLRAPREGETE